uniref:NADH dehydrogenase [ubiquinone] 1 subunit C1, mitochondrial n=2 Tax=Canis lupus familiaris TaxID=9615 RepID=A0A8C0QCR5_CANLF
ASQLGMMAPSVRTMHLLGLRPVRVLSESPHDKPDRLEVGLTLGTSVFLWIHLIKQHNEDVSEYKRRNGLE